MIKSHMPNTDNKGKFFPALRDRLSHFLRPIAIGTRCRCLRPDAAVRTGRATQRLPGSLAPR